jgi:hypothetical protein
MVCAAKHSAPQACRCRCRCRCRGLGRARRWLPGGAAIAGRRGPAKYARWLMSPAPAQPMMGMTGGPGSPPLPIDVGRNAFLSREPDCHLPTALIRQPAGAFNCPCGHRVLAARRPVYLGKCPEVSPIAGATGCAPCFTLPFRGIAPGRLSSSRPLQLGPDPSSPSYTNPFVTALTVFSGPAT